MSSSISNFSFFCSNALIWVLACQSSFFIILITTIRTPYGSFYFLNNGQSASDLFFLLKVFMKIIINVYNCHVEITWLLMINILSRQTARCDKYFWTFFFLIYFFILISFFFFFFFFWFNYWLIECYLQYKQQVQ